MRILFFWLKSAKICRPKLLLLFFLQAWCICKQCAGWMWSYDHLFETGSKDLNLQKPTLLLQRIKSGLNICRPRVWTNIYVRKNCLISLEQLCNFPIFPKAPDKKSLVKNVNISLSASEVDGLQLLGFPQPNVLARIFSPLRRMYFAEVWLSSSHNWKNGRKIEYTKPINTTAMGFGTVDHILPTNRVKLFSVHKYYVEITYSRGGQSEGQSLIQLAWKRPDRTGFELIQREFFSPYKNDSDKAQMCLLVHWQR